MVYQSQISFTLDTTCPWTYIAKKRLEIALDEFHAAHRDDPPPIAFRLHIDPFQLNPSFPATADRRAWHLEHKHMGDAGGQRALESHLSGLAGELGLPLRFDGEAGNTLEAHRVVQHFQRAEEEEREEGGGGVGEAEDKGGPLAGRIVDGLYARYFGEGQHPSSEETLIEACVAAGVDGDEAARVVRDHGLGLREVKARIREVELDNDAVPVVVVEGKRRDVTLTGAKEVKDYVKALETVTKEST